MGDPLIGLLITIIILGIIFGVAWAILQVIPLPGPFKHIAALVFWGLVAIVLIVKVLVPLLAMA